MEDADAEALYRPVTPAELQKARAFLVERLLPDLAASKERFEAVRVQTRSYERLLIQVRELEERSRKGVKQGAGEVHEADGLVIPGEHSTAAKPIVSMGLGDIYLEMTPAKARAFVSARLKMLNKRQDRLQEAVSQVEAVVHLSSTTLSRLEALHRGDAVSVLADE